MLKTLLKTQLESKTSKAFFSKFQTKFLTRHLKFNLLFLKSLGDSFESVKLSKVFEHVQSIDVAQVSMMQDVEESSQGDHSDYGDEDEEVKADDSGKADLTQATKRAFEGVWIQILSKLGTNKALTKRILITLPKTVLPNFSNPLLLADFLTGCLEDKSDLEMQVYALKSLFLLLQEHNFDCPKYYEKLYDLLLPQRTSFAHGFTVVSIF